MSKDRELELKLEHLYAQRNSGVKLGLDVSASLMAELGDPQNSYAVVHVAGTNGKGSVCALVSSVLREAGFTVGVYTSPHLVEFNERICVNGKNVSDDQLMSLAAKVDEAIPGVVAEHGREPTFFEYSTAMAFKFFAEQNVQIAVVEAGMGGRLDATNVALPLVSVITRISLEHTEYLGSDITSIAGEKAGIIKPSRPVVCGAMPEEARAVVESKAADQAALLRAVEDSVTLTVRSMTLEGTSLEASTESRTYGRLSTALVGQHQVENVATAIAAVEEVERAMGVDLPEDCIKDGLAQAVWPGRFHVLADDPPVIVDGAHNPGAASVLNATLVRVLGGRPVALILGVCGDKDLAAFLRSLTNVRKVWAVTIRTDRAISADDLAETVSSLGIPCEASALAQALEEAQAWAGEVDGAVCVAGSLFLAGEVLEYKGVL